MAHRNALLALLLAIVVLLLGPIIAQRPRGLELYAWGRCVTLDNANGPARGDTCDGSMKQNINFDAPHLRWGSTQAYCLATEYVFGGWGSGNYPVLGPALPIRMYFCTLPTEQFTRQSNPIVTTAAHTYALSLSGTNSHCLEMRTDTFEVFANDNCNIANSKQYFRRFIPLMFEFILYLSQSRCMAAESIQHEAFVELADCNPNDGRQLWVYDRPSKNIKLLGTNLCLREVPVGSYSDIQVQNCNSNYLSMRWSVPATIFAWSNPGDDRIVSDDNSGLNIPFLSGSSRLSGWAPDAGNLQNQRIRRWQCRAVAGHLWNTNDFCASCTNPGGDPATGCTTCRTNWDLSTGCTTCLGNYDETADCAQCVDDWDLSSGCTLCVNRGIEATECATCDNEYSPATRCRDCNVGWHDTSGCTTCSPGSTGAECDVCQPGFNATTECAFCEGKKESCFAATMNAGHALQWGGGRIFGETATPEECHLACVRASDCDKFVWTSVTQTYGTYYITTYPANTCSLLRAWTTPIGTGVAGFTGPKFCNIGPGPSEWSNCETCRSDLWDVATACTTCVYGWNAQSNCLECDNDRIDPATNCTTCKFTRFSVVDSCSGTCINNNFVEESGPVGCGFCRSGFDEASDCLSCRNSWAGADCDVCAALDEFSDCTEAECVCGEELGSCSIDGVVTSIWNETELVQPLVTNETNVTVAQCADGVTPKDIYRHLSCAAESLEGLSRAFDCSAAWLRVSDLSNLTRVDLSTFNGIVRKVRQVALDGTLSGSVRTKAAQLAATWQVVTQMGRGLHYDYLHPNRGAILTTKFPAPPLVTPLGSVALFQTAAARRARLSTAISDYMDIFSADTVLETCRAWFYGFGRCECGAKVDASGACIMLDASKMANLYTVNLFCSVAEGVAGTSASVEIIQRTHNCIKREVWKDQDHKTLGELLKAARASARVSMLKALSAGNTTVADTLAELQLDATETMVGVAGNMSAMAAFGGDSVARITAADVSRDLGDALLAELRSEITGVAISDGAAAVEAYMSVVSSQISSQMEANFQQTAQTLEGIADLIMSTSTSVLETTTNGFMQMASAELQKVQDEIVLKEEIMFQLRGKFLASQEAIEFDFDQIETEVERTFPIGEIIGATTEDFYKCKRDQELAALARKRAMAFFDIVVGCVEIGMELGAMCVSGGGSAIAKGGVKAASKRIVQEIGESAYKNAKQNAKVTVARKGVEQWTDNTYGTLPDDKEARQRNVIDSITAVLGDSFRAELEDYAMTGEDKRSGVSDFSRASNSAYDMFKKLDMAGVPFVGGAGHILKGVAVLADYGKMKDEINGKYEANLAKSREALDLLGELVAKVGEFAADLMLEFGQLSILNVPEVSVIESRSQTFWRAMQNNIISFAKSTDMYVDMKNEAKRRALSEAPWGDHRQLLVKLKRFDPEAETDAPETRALLESRAGVRGAEVETVDMRRALDSKKADCNLGDKARIGLAAFSDFFDQLDEIIFFCEGLHSNLIRFIETTRTIITTTLRLKQLRRLEQTYTEARDSFMVNATELAAFGSTFQRVLQRSYQRTRPSITSAKPRLFDRTVLSQDKFLWRLCNAVRYKFLRTLPACNFYIGQLAASPAGTGELGALEAQLDSIKTQLTTDLNVNLPRLWMRLPIQSALQIRSTIGVNETVSTASVFNFSLDGPPEVMQGADCGYNHEIVTYGFVLESRSNGQLHPPALEDWYTVEVDLHSPMVKLDGAGNRHVFLTSDKPQDFGTGRATRVAPEAEVDCGEPGYPVRTVVIRDGVHRLCVQSAEESSDGFGVSPVSPWGTTFSVSLQDLAPLVANEDLDLELVMYAQLSGEDMNIKCEAHKFASRKLPGTDSAASGLDAAVIVGVSLGAVALAAAGAFAAKKYLATRSAKIATAKLITTGGTANPMAQL